MRRFFHHVFRGESIVGVTTTLHERAGYLRRSLTDYSSSSKDRKVYLTNTHFQSMKAGFKLSEHIWTFQALQDYLTQEGKIPPPPFHTHPNAGGRAQPAQT